MKRHTKKWKHAQFAELVKVIDSYPVIAIADLEGFPSALFQRLRKKLHGKAVVRVSKTKVIAKALEASNKKHTRLKDYADKSIAVIATEMSPFELYSFLKKNKGSVPAKEGTVAPMDIVVPARDTGLPPGPALSDLKAAGLNVRIVGATIHIIEEKVIIRKGEIVSKPVAGTLSKLDIKPLKVGLNIAAALEGDTVYKADVLDIDAEKVFGRFASAYRDCLCLALEIRHFSKDTVELLVKKAFVNGKAVALKGNILTSATVAEILAKASAQAESVKASMPEAKGEAAPAKEEATQQQ